MISLHVQKSDKFSQYGIRHFFEKFGIPVQINSVQESGIIVSYGSPVRGDFVISIEENEIQKKICGTISTPLGKIHICETPRDAGPRDDAIAYYENGITRYPCVVRHDHGIFIGIDIFRETGYLLSGHLDTIRPSLEISIKNEITAEPSVDFLENILFEAILAACRERNIPLVQKSFWPEGKKFAVCLTHDVDEIKKTYQWISRPLRYLARKDMSGFFCQISSFLQKIQGIEPYYTYDDIIRIEHDLGAKSTYFILKESGKASLLSKKTWYLYGRNRSLQRPDIQALIRKLLTNGDEVAIHGSYFSYKDPLLIRKEIMELESIIHENVKGTRQHNLNLEIPATWNYQVSAGLLYDTTLGFRDAIGFRWGTSFPFFPNTGEGQLPLLEIPLIIMDICLESSKSKEADCLQIAEEVERYHGVLNLLWHPPIFNTLEYADARDIYISLNQHCKVNGAWIARACDIYQWLILRNRNSFTCSYDALDKILKIVPGPAGPGEYLTLYLPGHMTYKILTENAQIICKDENRVVLKTHNGRNKREILVGLS